MSNNWDNQPAFLYDAYDWRFWNIGMVFVPPAMMPTGCEVLVPGMIVRLLPGPTAMWMVLTSPPVSPTPACIIGSELLAPEDALLITVIGSIVWPFCHSRVGLFILSVPDGAVVKIVVAQLGKPRTTLFSTNCCCCCGMTSPRLMARTWGGSARDTSCMCLPSPFDNSTPENSTNGPTRTPDGSETNCGVMEPWVGTPPSCSEWSAIDVLKWASCSQARDTAVRHWRLCPWNSSRSVNSCLHAPQMCVSTNSMATTRDGKKRHET